MATVGDLTQECTDQLSAMIVEDMEKQEHSQTEFDQILDGIFADEEMQYWRKLSKKKRGYSIFGAKAFYVLCYDLVDT
jgi:hypothetical protein